MPSSTAAKAATLASQASKEALLVRRMLTTSWYSPLAATQSQSQAQAATIASLETGLNTATAAASNLNTSKAAAQDVVDSSARATLTPAVGNPFTALTGPRDPRGPRHRPVPYDTVATPGCTSQCRNLWLEGRTLDNLPVAHRLLATVTTGTSSSVDTTAVREVAVSL